MNIKFNSENHTYEIDGQIVPSVTQVLKSIDTNCYCGVEPEVRDNAARKGTLIHKICELYDLGELVESSVDYRLMPYFEQYRLFVDKYKPMYCQIEKSLFSDKLGVAGTIDRSGVIDDNPFVLDVKTGSRKRDHDLQLAGYGILDAERISIETGITIYPKTLTRYCLYLKPDSYKLHECKNSEDFEVFESAVKIHNWKNKFKKGQK